MTCALRGAKAKPLQIIVFKSEEMTMAIYSCNISNVSRAKGSSACATLSYISAEKIVDERLGMTFSYGREERVMLTGTLLPEGAPKEFQDPKVLFNIVRQEVPHF